MDTLAPTSTVRCTTLRLTTTRHTEFVDVTEQLEAVIARTGLQAGLVMVQTRHTTTGMVVNEHEPRLLEDFVAMLEELAPCDAEYRHHGAPPRNGHGIEERRNGHAHCRALLLPPSAGLVVAGGRLQLGRWQRVFLAELDGPQVREIVVLAVGEYGR
jgi:secondary thiamine-phosphate synthase enzyme